MLESFHFLRPTALFLALPALVLWWFWRRNADPLRGWRSQIEAPLLSAITDQAKSSRLSHWPLLIAWLIAITALAGPTWRPEPSPFADDATPLVILLNASKAMEDSVPSPSKIERAHLKISDLAAAREPQPLGLIAYAGSAHLVLPPTRDTGVVASMAAEITPGIMPVEGNRIDLAIQKAAGLVRGNGGTLLIVTGPHAANTEQLGKAYLEAGSPHTQVLAIAADGEPLAPLDGLLETLDAKLVGMTADDADISEIIDSAARPPVARNADGTEIWQDAGYTLVPVLSGFALLGFRRKKTNSTPE